LAEEKSLKLELELEKQNLRDLLRTSENQASSLESTVYRLRKEVSENIKLVLVLYMHSVVLG